MVALVWVCGTIYSVLVDRSATVEELQRAILQEKRDAFNSKFLPTDLQLFVAQNERVEWAVMGKTFETQCRGEIDLMQLAPQCEDLMTIHDTGMLTAHGDIELKRSGYPALSTSEHQFLADAKPSHSGSHTTRRNMTERCRGDCSSRIGVGKSNSKSWRDGDHTNEWVIWSFAWPRDECGQSKYMCVRVAGLGHRHPRV